MQITNLGSDGLRISARSTLSQLAADELLAEFADGLILTSLKHTDFSGTLAEALHHHTATVYPLITALLALDAEVDSMIDDRRRVFPLPGFLSYRAKLSPDKFPLNTLRLPPLNPDGHYLFAVITGGAYLAVRLDLHPRLKVMGHVRLVLSSSKRAPARLQAVEHRLDRQVLAKEIITAAITAGDEALAEPLSSSERQEIFDVLDQLIPLDSSCCRTSG